jgi:hypothetical protein
MIKFIRNHTTKMTRHTKTVFHKYEVYSGANKREAIQFLSTLHVNEPLKYVVVQTPEGSWGRDIAGIYKEGELPTQYMAEIANSEWGKREMAKHKTTKAPTVVGDLWIRTKDGWVLDGTSMEEVSRNDPCPCGSGKKFKYCCIDGGFSSSKAVTAGTAAEEGTSGTGDSQSERNQHDITIEDTGDQPGDFAEYLRTRQPGDPVETLVADVAAVINAYNTEVAQRERESTCRHSDHEPLLTDELIAQLPDFAEMDKQVKQYSDYQKLPIYIHYFHVVEDWHWYVLSGEPSDAGFDFFGYVVGWNDQLGHFDLAWLEHGFVEWCGKPRTRVQRDPDFEDKVLADVSTVQSCPTPQSTLL